ncbi:Histone H2B [Forsythia ovata]|uniref:Histone H2B n=1 Tax=Forsythia ovata TaxID=205694 RepID=A0ABD1TBM0_9LAMI
MAPKADKKPTEKKPAAEKALAEKKPKAGKKLPKEAGAAAGDKKKKRVKKNIETNKIYIFKVLKLRRSPDLPGTTKNLQLLLVKFRLLFGWFYLENWPNTLFLRIPRPLQISLAPEEFLRVPLFLMVFAVSI